VSRNAKNINLRPCVNIKTQGCRFVFIFVLIFLTSFYQKTSGQINTNLNSEFIKTNRNTVIIVRNRNAITAYEPNTEKVVTMLQEGIKKLTKTSDAKSALLKVASTNDVIGIKVYSTPGRYSGTRPAVIDALITLMIESGFSKSNIIIWDKNLNTLIESGYSQIAAKHGVLLCGAAEYGYDDNVFYEKPLIGNLVYGDHEFGKKGEGVGRKSFMSKLLTQKITKIISVAPVINNNTAMVSGHLYSLAFGSVDNTLRFESSRDKLNEAIPEIFAMPQIYDRAVLYITDAFICQYEGGPTSMLHYSVILGQLWFSFDPVILDTLAMEEIYYRKAAMNHKSRKPDYELFQNASLLELGNCDTRKANIQTIDLN